MDTTFTIQQISTLTGLTAHTLRYYERIGLLAGVARNEQGYRLYSEQDLLWLEFLIRLRDTGMPISEMKRFSDLRSQGLSTVSDRRRMLEGHQERVRLQMDELEKNLLRIEEKIEIYKKIEGETTRLP